MCVKWGGGVMEGRWMEVKGQPQVWSTWRQNSSSFDPLGDFPISTSHLLSRSWACSFVVQFAYLHGFWEFTLGCLCWGGKGLYHWAISPAGNTNRKHRTLANELVPSLLQKEGWQDQPYCEIKGDHTRATSPVVILNNMATVRTAPPARLSLFHTLMSLVMNTSEHLIDQGPQNQHNTHAI